MLFMCHSPEKEFSGPYVSIDYLEFVRAFLYMMKCIFSYISWLQGGIVSAMTINRGILLGFVPSGDNQVNINHSS